eukprot:CCRYP_014723-RB/>CCRYP_014723-RB protein AED:0.28 eAED:0.28 QI:98/1/1/1/0.5/0.33/3/1947/640
MSASTRAPILLLYRRLINLNCVPLVTLRCIPSVHRSSNELQDLTSSIGTISALGLTRYVSSSNSLQDTSSDDSDGEEASSSPSRIVDVAEIGPHGGHVTLNYGPDDCFQSTFHASWLWSNDPKKVMLPSGQRTCTPGQWSSVYGRPKIKHAKIIYCIVGSGGEDTDDAEPKRSLGSSIVSDASKLNVPGPTTRDCSHALPVYGTYPPWVSVSSRSNGTGDSNLRPYLQIQWSLPNNDDTFDTESFYDTEWLERLRYDDNARSYRRKKTEVTPIHAIRRSGPPLCYSLETAPVSERGRDHEQLRESIASKHAQDGLFHVNYRSLISADDQINERGLFNLMDAVFRDGAAIVSETPCPEKLESDNENDFPVAKIAKAMSGGSLSHGGLYGSIFHVRDGERNSNNVAYTSVPLCPHQDLAYYESPPGIQLLHCVAMGNGVLGGESTLIDALAAAYRLRELRPDSFECLVQCPATFVKQRGEACMTYRTPHIVLAEDGYSRSCSKSLIDREIVAVYWSPPFEGPVLLPPSDVDRYYEAYADFERLLDNSLSANGDSDDLSLHATEFTWERKLAPGEVLIFNNRRMLHGRRGFSVQKDINSNESQRHLVGCYTNIDDTLSCYRVLLRKSHITHILNVCNRSNVIP